jgi:RNA recognition motif-containing protein
VNTKVYVDNLAIGTAAMELMKLFSVYGNVVDVNITVDRNNHKPCGSGFVTMVTPEGARAAIHALHGKQIESRTLMVSERCPPENRPALNHRTS